MGVTMKAPKLTVQLGRTLLASWSKLSDSGGSTFNVKATSKTNTKKKVTHYDACNGYEVQWWYGIGAGSWILDRTDTIKSKVTTICEYEPPTNATKVYCKVRATFKEYETVVAKTSGGKTTYSTTKKPYYTGSFASSNSITLAKNVLDAPSEPNVTVSGTTATISVDYRSDYCNQILFEWETSAGGSKQQKTITSSNGKFSTAVSIGAGTSVRAQAMALVKTGVKYYANSPWSGYCDWSDASTPGKPSNLQVRAADMDNTVEVSWTAPDGGAESYEIQYVHTSKALFSSADAKSDTTTETTYYVTGLDASLKWYFRVRSVTATGTSGWVTYGESTNVSGDDGTGSGGTSAAVDTDPTAPTSFQSDSVAAKGDTVTLGWVHNCEDGCTAQSSTVYLSRNGGSYTTVSLGSGVYRYALPTSGYSDGDKIAWYVTTTAPNGSTSPASAVRTIEVYEAPSVRVSVAETVTALPIEVTVANGGSTGAAVAYTCTVTAATSYDAVGSDGEIVRVREGQTVWSGRADTTADSHVFTIGAGDATIVTGERYNVTASIATKSGLRADSGTASFSTDMSSASYSIACDIVLDYDSASADIAPVAFLAEDGETVPDNVRLSVVRIESGGELVPIAVNIPNGGGVTIPDLHPRLDMASYRVTTTDTTTGAVEYEDFFEPFGIESAIFNWDEWADSQDDDGHVAYMGKRLELPYSVSLQEDYSPDVALTEYIGRKHPVAAYGTQKGATASISTKFWRDDTETVELLRELAGYSGDVYVREPSGIGYWAQVGVSITQSAEDEYVEASLSIARVDHEDKPMEVS